MGTKDDEKSTKVEDKKEAPATGAETGAATGTGIAPAAGTALAVVDFGEDAGKGMTNISNEERKIPFLRILQSNSPQCEEGNVKFMPNAKAGMFINTSTGQLYDKLILIACARDHKYVEYTPRSIGGGFVAVHKPDEELILMLRAKHGKFGRLPNNVTRKDNEGKPLDGTEIVESFELYAILIDPATGSKFRAVVPFQSTQIGKYQTFVDRTDSIEYQSPEGGIVKPPIWAHRWLMTTASERNKKGAFKGYVIGLEGKKPDGSDDLPIKSLVKKSDPLYVMAKEFNEYVEAGKVEADYEADAKKGSAVAEDEVEM